MSERVESNAAGSAACCCTLLRKTVRRGGKSADRRSGEIALGDVNSASLRQGKLVTVGIPP